MHTRRALVTAGSIAGLATTYRLLRSDWDVVLLTTTAARPDGIPAALNDFGRDAARRLGLLPADGADIAAVLNAALGDSVCRSEAEVSALVVDDCGVTATFRNGDEDWFDLVVDADDPAVSAVSTVDGATRRVALIGNAAWHFGPHPDAASLAIAGAEMLGDALDIFPGTDEALGWWERTLRPYVRRAQAGKHREGTWDSPNTRSVSSTR